MVYVDTSVLVALFLNEPHSQAATQARNAQRLKMKVIALRDTPV